MNSISASKDEKIKRFKLDSSLHEDPIDVEDLKESCVIFDDTDCIADKKIRQAVTVSYTHLTLPTKA